MGVGALSLSGRDGHRPRKPGSSFSLQIARPPTKPEPKPLPRRNLSRQLGAAPTHLEVRQARQGHAHVTSGRCNREAVWVCTGAKPLNSSRQERSSCWGEGAVGKP